MTFPTPNLPELIAAVIFVIAVAHTFSTKLFSRLAHRHPGHAGLFHLLGEVEVVFGFWAFVLVAALVAVSGKDAAVTYLEERSYIEPAFVLVIMVIAASRPILQAALSLVRTLARVVPLHEPLAVYALALSVVPLLGSFITEPAAMTLAAIILRDACFANRLSERLKYATLGVLFVNVSIGGTLTHFAAPPVLMVAAKWQWDTAYMLTHFGWRSALAIAINTAAVTWLFRHEIAAKAMLDGKGAGREPVPLTVTAVHLAFLCGVVFFAHHPVVFMGLFLFFIGFTEAYKRHQDRLFLREGLLVAFFLAGLVTLGGLQQWWLQATLNDVDSAALYYLATALTPITDNAALTYLGSLVDGVSPEFKYALVSGAVTGGGLTVIANAPNPAAYSILKGYFRDDAISALNLFLAAALPTCVAIVSFRWL